MNMIKAISKRLDVMERAAPKFFSITDPATGAVLSFDPIRMAGFDPAGNEVFRLSTADGSATFNGPVKIGGTLDLPAGIIGNDALANPILTDTASNYLSSYAITTATTVRASITLTVPTGFTQAVVIANASAMGYNNTAASDYLYVQAVVQGVGGGELYSAAGAGLGVGLASPFHTTLTGLTDGQTITVSITTRTSTATWAASASNMANIYATALYLR